MDGYHQIISGLYLGSEDSIEECIQKENVTVFVRVMVEEPFDQEKDYDPFY